MSMNTLKEVKTKKSRKKQDKKLASSIALQPIDMAASKVNEFDKSNELTDSE